MTDLYADSSLGIAGMAGQLADGSPVNISVPTWLTAETDHVPVVLVDDSLVQVLLSVVFSSTAAIADLTTRISLTGQANAQAATDGDLTIATLLNADGSIQAFTTANLEVLLELVADTVSLTDATADLQIMGRPGFINPVNPRVIILSAGGIARVLH